jgi:plastocyanin
VTQGDDLRFQPPMVTVSLGRQVRWTNTGSTPHNVTFDTFRPSSTMNSGDDYQLRFEIAGTFHYVCTFHAPGMAGTVVVTR